jgi:hypothetical protein
MVTGSLTSLPSALLTKVLEALPSAADLAHASASCRELRQAACWRTAFERFYGQHSARWAEVAARGSAVDYRALLAMRMSASVSRAAGRSHLRTLYYSFASNPVRCRPHPSRRHWLSLPTSPRVASGVRRRYPGKTHTA